MGSMNYLGSDVLPVLPGKLLPDSPCPWPDCSDRFEAHLRAEPNRGDGFWLRVAGFCRTASHESDLYVLPGGQGLRLAVVPRPDRFLWMRAQYLRWRSSQVDAFERGGSSTMPFLGYDPDADARLHELVGGSPVLTAADIERVTFVHEESPLPGARGARAPQSEREPYGVAVVPEYADLRGDL